MNYRPRLPLYAIAALLAIVGAAGCSKPPEVAVVSPAASAVNSNVADADVTEHVKSALNQNDSLKGFDIQIVTLKGDVRMTGILDNQSQIDDAVRLARAADGAHTVHNELTVKK